MENIQVNGQRRWGPPCNWSGPPPPHGTEVFIKNLAEDVHEVDLFELFSIVGEIYEVRLPIHWSGVNRGYAFVRFTCVRDADVAIKLFDHFEIRSNRKIRVQRSVDNTRLFLSAVPREKNGEELLSDLTTVVENIKKVYVYPTVEDRSLYRGYAFVEFETHRDAAIAKRALSPDICCDLFDKKCIAAWANPLPYIEVDVLQKLNVLFIRNIPNNIKSFQLKKEFEKIVRPEDLTRVKKLNDFAFASFSNHEIAKHCMEVLQMTHNIFSEYAMNIEWAIPKELGDPSSDSSQDFCSASSSAGEGYSSAEENSMASAFGEMQIKSSHLDKRTRFRISIQKKKSPLAGNIQKQRSSFVPIADTECHLENFGRGIVSNRRTPDMIHPVGVMQVSPLSSPSSSPLAYQFSSFSAAPNAWHCIMRENINPTGLNNGLLCKNEHYRRLKIEKSCQHQCPQIKMLGLRRYSKFFNC